MRRLDLLEDLLPQVRPGGRCCSVQAFSASRWAQRVRRRPCRAATRSRRRPCRRGGSRSDGDGARRPGSGGGRRRRRRCVGRARVGLRGHARRLSEPRGSGVLGERASSQRLELGVGRGERAHGPRRRSRRSRTAPSPGRRPAPHTQPRPCSACTTSMPGCHRRARRAGRRVELDRPVEPALVVGPVPVAGRRRTGRPGSSRRARRRRPRAAGPRRRCRPRRAACGPAGDHPARCRWGRQRRGPGVGGEVVQPHLERDGATRQPRLAQPLGDLARPAGRRAPRAAAGR